MCVAVVLAWAMHGHYTFCELHVCSRHLSNISVVVVLGWGEERVSGSVRDNMSHLPSGVVLVCGAGKLLDDEGCSESCDAALLSTGTCRPGGTAQCSQDHGLQGTERSASRVGAHKESSNMQTSSE